MLATPKPDTPVHPHKVPIALATLLFLCGTNIQAGTSASELTNLDLILRQLDAIDRITQSSEALLREDGARFFFDYPRLSADIGLIRQGIRAYQSPSRAQPRQPPELTGHYTSQADAPR